MKKKVCSFFPSPSCCFNLPLRHDLGHKIKELNEKLDQIFNDREKYGIEFNRQPEVVERLITTSFGDESNIIGCDNYREELLSNLLGVGSPKESKTCVISLVGTGGLGKTTRAQIAYNHSEVKAHFDKRMWVCVSYPFDQCKVAKAIIQELDPKHESLNNTTSSLQALLRMVCDLIREKRYFLVFDGVWAKDSTKESEKWEPFRNALTCGAQGSKILVTTRDEVVAHMMGSATTDIINLGNLSVEHCWLIIRKKTFFDDNIDQHKELEPLGRQLAVKCKGLPLAAKLIGGYMWNKRSKEEWVKDLESILWDLEDVEKGLLGPLLLSYYELSPTEKQCFLFCVVFPKDYVIYRFELVTHWIAQGYIDTKRNIEMEDIAENYFQKLAMRSFFQDFKEDENDGRIKHCKMHDIVHDFAQLVTRNEYFEINGDKHLEIDCKSARHLRLEISKEMQILELVYHAKILRTLFLLSCLRTLSDFNIGGIDDKEGCKLGELKNLCQLRGSLKMHGLGNVVDVGEAQNAQLKKKIHLHDLELDFSVERRGEEEAEKSKRRMDSDVAVLNALEPPPHLEKFSIKGVMRTTVYTNWMTSLTNLKSLVIHGCCQLECLPPLGRLPFLKVLQILYAPNIRKVRSEFLGIDSEELESKNKNKKGYVVFLNLKSLEFWELEKWEEWIGIGGTREE